MSRDRTTPSLTIAELGKVLTQGLMLYRADWQTYAKLSAQAYAWLWVPIYGWNRYLALSGVISRLGFAQLNQETFTTKQIQADLKRCGFKFFWLSLRLRWRILWVSLLVTMLCLFLLSIIAAALNLDNLIPSEPPFPWPFMVFAIAIYLFPIWPYSGLFLAEVTLAINPGQCIRDSLSSSRQSTRGNRWQIIGLILSTIVLSAPIATLIAQVLPSIWLGLQAGPQAIFRVANLLISITTPIFVSSPLVILTTIGQGIYQLMNLTSWQMAISVLLSMACFTTAAIATLPLWQLVKSVLYYKLLCSQEGIDLKLSTRS